MMTELPRLNDPRHGDGIRLAAAPNVLPDGIEWGQHLAGLLPLLGRGMVIRGTLAGSYPAASAPVLPVTIRAPRRRRALAPLLAVAVATGLMFGAGPPVQAHESDQYTLPAGRDFADLGPLLSRNFLAAIRDAVAGTNAAIDSALAAGDLPARVQALQSAGHVAGEVWAHLFVTYPANELLDLGLISSATRASYPGLVTM